MLNKYGNALALTVLAVSAGTAANAQTYTKTITLPVSTSSAEQIAVDPIGNKIFVAVTNFGAKPYDYLVEIDGKTDTIVKSVQIPPIGYAIAVEPGLVYVAGTDSNNNSKVATFRESDLKEIDSVTVSTTPAVFGLQAVAIDPLNGDAYVSNPDDNEIDVIHCGKVKARISTGANAPFGLSVNLLLNTIYAAELGGNVAVVDGKTNTIISNNTVGADLEGIAVNPFTGDVLTPSATYALSSTTAVLSAAGAPLANVPVGNTPIGIALDPFTSLAFVANTQDGTVSRITDNGASSTNATPATFPISALFLAVNPVTKKVYASSASSEPTVTVFSEK